MSAKSVSKELKSAWEDVEHERMEEQKVDKEKMR